MEQKLLNQNIKILELSSKIIHTLEINGIITIEQLCDKTKTNLKDIGLFSHDIHDIEISLQLNDLDLKNNKY